MALIAALREEARGILKGGGWSKVESNGPEAMYERRFGSGEAVLVVSGVGRARAEAATHAVLEERRPDAVLSLGFAGGLAAGQRAGDLVVARELAPADGGPNGEQRARLSEAIRADSALADRALSVMQRLGLRCQAGMCVTASSVVSRPDAKRRLGLDAGALAVEMESFWTGLVCRERKTPFLAARAIVDAVERPLPDFIVRSASDAEAGNRWRDALAVALRPGSVSELIRLGGAASKAKKALAAFVSGFLRAWSRPAGV